MNNEQLYTMLNSYVEDDITFACRITSDNFILINPYKLSKDWLVLGDRWAIRSDLMDKGSTPILSLNGTFDNN